MTPSVSWAETSLETEIDSNPFDSLQLHQLDEQTWQLIDTDTGEATIGVFSNDGTTLHITHGDGSTSVVTYAEDGTVLLDGMVLFEISPSPSVALRSVPSGYVPLVTHRTHVSAYQNVYDTILALIGLIPVVGGVVSVLEALFRDHSLDDAYIEIAQYYHPRTYYVYTVVRFYRNSNYTGLLATREYGPYPPV